MRAVIADTGPLYAARDPDDQHHRRAQDDLRRLDESGISVLIPYPTYLEAYTLVLYRLGPAQAHGFADDLYAGASFINPSVDDYLVATQRARRFADQRLSLFDTVAAALSARLDFPVWTYDHHFDLMRAAVWRR